ncbi:hypothetical protein HDU97_000110 [Phlyctochytrium planicorne]|nr:hypothetical protein HDU97_000110 [Phlyctochytrium planicorne]
MPKSKGSLDDALENAKDIEYHQHLTNDNYTVKVHDRQGGVATWTNISPDHMEKIKSTYSAAKNKPHAGVQHGSIDQILADGGTVTDIRDHEKSDSYSVYVKRADSDEQMVFTNISGEHVEAIRKKFPDLDDSVEEILDPTYNEEEEEIEDEGESELVAAGEEVMSVESNEDGTYTVNMKAKGGAKDVLKGVDEEDIFEYVEVDKAKDELEE